MAIYRGKNRIGVTILVDKEDDLNTELTEQEEKLNLLESKVADLPQDKPEQDKFVVPSNDRQIIVADSGFKLNSVTVEPQESYGEELTTQQTLLADLEADVNALEDKPKSDVQYMIDQTNSCYYLFYYFKGTDLDFVNNLDTSNVTDMEYMFGGCENLTSLDLSNWDTSNVTDMQSMFKSCIRLTTLDLSNFNTNKLIKMSSIFSYCPSLTSLDLSNWDTSNVRDFQGAFSENGTLVDIIGTLDVIRSSTALNGVFYNCVELANVTLKNIKKTLQLGSGTSYGTKLSNASLINTIQELWDLTGSSSQTLTLSTTSKTNISNIYVKLITPTAEQIEADPYINNKKPCVVCDSSEDGAMLITEYLISKNWNLA